ncbi:hypothetical protein ACFZB6_26695 [Streptomyces syringium]|uniref:hypothetical protein n=1 Tax=Streptomyces syringium TaxID=76729 RepID=UPI0036EFAC56
MADEQTAPGNGPEDEHQGAPTDQGAGTGDEHQGEADSKPEGDQAEDVTAERAARVAAEKEAAELKAETARLRRANAAQKGTDLDALRSEIRQEFTAQLVRAELRAAAAGKLRDPADALALLDVAALAGEGGDIDTAAVAAAVEQLVKDKPYLAAETTGPAAWGDVGAGPRETAEPEPATPLDRLRRGYGNS